MAYDGRDREMGRRNLRLQEDDPWVTRITRIDQKTAPRALLIGLMFMLFVVLSAYAADGDRHRDAS